MSKTVYLHIGMPKTGTTALQMFLPENEALLNEKGFTYPMMPFRFENIGIRRNGHFLTVWDNKENMPEWGQGFSVVKEALQKFDNVILSDENIWSRQRLDNFWEDGLAEFEKIGAKVRVIAYLRSQDDQVESNWNQKVKDKKTRMKITFEKFMEEERYWYMPFHYNEVLDRISSYIGKDNLTVRVYEKQQFIGGSLFADFLDAIGLGLTEDYKLPDYVPNVRLPNTAVEIKRLINLAYKDEDVPDFYREIISRVYEMKAIQEAPKRDTSMFSPVMREKFMAQFAEGNAYVAREYLHRADGVLFRGELSSLKQWKMDDHEILMDMIRIFAAEGVYQYKRHEDLRTSVRQLRAYTKKLEERSNRRHERIKEQIKDLPTLAAQIREIYNSVPFRAYRKLRDKKDGKPKEES